MLVLFALGNAKELSFALGDAKVANANGFASQWNIGLTLFQNTTFTRVTTKLYNFFKTNIKQGSHRDWKTKEIKHGHGKVIYCEELTERLGL